MPFKQNPGDLQSMGRTQTGLQGELSRPRVHRSGSLTSWEGLASSTVKTNTPNTGPHFLLSSERTTLVSHFYLFLAERPFPVPALTALDRCSHLERQMQGSTLSSLSSISFQPQDIAMATVIPRHRRGIRNCARICAFPKVTIHVEAESGAQVLSPCLHPSAITPSYREKSDCFHKTPDFLLG